MPKINLLTTISLFVNIFLTFWLVNQYVSDVYFQNYVNNAVGQYYAFIILTIGVGGGSSLGYLFLKKRHSDGSLASKIQKSKSFKPVSPLLTPSSTASAARSSLPTGAPPSQVSKHTVYAVPPLPKSSSPSGTKTIPTSSWAAASKPATGPLPSSKQEFPNRPGTSNLPPPKELPRPSSQSFTTPTQPMARVSPPSFTTPTQTIPPSPLRSIGETPSRASTWSMPKPPSEEKLPENGPIFEKPGMDVNATRGSGFSDYSTSVKGPESSPVPSKWAPPPENKPSPNQWTDTGVRSIPPLPTKWSPPSTTPGVQDRPPPPQAIPRPGQLPPRNPMSPMSQGAPRPFGIPSPGRPSEPRPVAAPQPFRPNPLRPPLGPNPQQRPPQTSPRPPSPVGGPMPQPWTPSSETAEKKDPADPSDTQGSLTKPGLEPRNSSETNQGGGGEMDWDTALDTILKTLRKDRVGDSK